MRSTDCEGGHHDASSTLRSLLSVTTRVERSKKRWQVSLIGRQHSRELLIVDDRSEDVYTSKS